LQWFSRVLCVFLQVFETYVSFICLHTYVASVIVSGCFKSRSGVASLSQ